MIPVRTNASNSIYHGDPEQGVSDVWVEIDRPGLVGITWQPDDEERAAIAAGANIQLLIVGEPIPPTIVGVSQRKELSAIGAAIRDRALKVIALLFPEQSNREIPLGWWLVSQDVFDDIIASEALDPALEGAPPTMFRKQVVVDLDTEARGKIVYQRAPEAPGSPLPRPRLVQ